MRRARRFATAAAALAMLGAAGPAFANGRFPRAQRRDEGGDPHHHVHAATYGLLVTSDRGGTWRHLCELGYAFTIDDLDPVVELTPDAALLATAAHSLNRSAPPYCDFAPVLGGAGTEAVVDFSLDRADRNRVLAVLMQSTGSRVTSRLVESTDAGLEFAPLGTPLPSSDVAFALTFDAAPNDPERFYVSARGRQSPQVLVRSDDGGASWSSIALPLAGDEYPYLAAVHPTNPDVIYLRTDHWMPSEDGGLDAHDALLLSEDGGRSFRELHRAQGKLFGFALSPDASEVLIAYGDPADPAGNVDDAALGIYRASTADHAFTKIFDGPVSCLAWTRTGVYACTSQSDHGFALGFAPDASFELATAEPFVPLLELARVAGPIDCPECSPGGACLARWSESCTVFGNCDAGAAATAGEPGDCAAGGASGASTNGGEAGTNGGEAGTGGGERRAASSCACRLSSGEDPSRSSAWWLVLAAVACGRGARRRRRARTPRR